MPVLSVIGWEGGVHLGQCQAIAQPNVSVRLLIYKIPAVWYIFMADNCYKQQKQPKESPVDHNSPISSTVPSRYVVLDILVIWIDVISSLSCSHPATRFRDDAHHTDKPLEWPRQRYLPSSEQARQLVFPGSWQMREISLYRSKSHH